MFVSDVSPIFNSLAKSNRTFYLPGRKYVVVESSEVEDSDFYVKKGKNIW